MPVAEDGMEVDDEVFLLGREGAALEVGTEVVDPAESAALAAALQPGVPSNVAPAALPVAHHVVYQLFVLLRRPQPLAQLITCSHTATAVAVTATHVICEQRLITRSGRGGRI